MLQNLPHVARLVDEGDNPHLVKLLAIRLSTIKLCKSLVMGVADRATQREGFVDSRQQHRPQIV